MPGRGLAVYLLYPRPDAWAKALIAPACYVLAAISTGHFGDCTRFVVLWLVLEFLVYAARYQWNDIRGIEGDQRHAEMRARSRLPAGATAQARRRSIRLSRAVAVARVAAALLIGALSGLFGQVLLLAGVVFVVAVVYEFLRALPARRAPVSGRAQAVAVWLAVGLGYLVRGGLGLRMGGLAWGSLAMVTGLMCVMAFGVMFVLLTWVLEATSYCQADAGGSWHARPELGAKPHLAALLRSLGRPILRGGIPGGHGKYCGNDRVLRGCGRPAAPWNLALFAAAAAGALEGTGLARARAGEPGVDLAAAAVGVAGAVLLACCSSGLGRWVTTAACAGALTGIACLADPTLPVLACAPWLAVASLYSAFRSCSYRDLVTAGPRLAATLRRIGWAGTLRLATRTKPSQMAIP